MKRAMIIGCPGSGKSTFARALRDKTGLPLHYLDRMNWNADRTTVPEDVFMARLQDAIRQDEWIIDGNYGGTIDLRIRVCDTVFFLDYPMEVCLAGVAARRGKQRPDMPWVEIEEDASFVEFIRNYASDSRPKILALLEKYAKEKNIIVFHSRGAAEEYLQML